MASMVVRLPKGRRKEDRLLQHVYSEVLRQLDNGDMRDIVHHAAIRCKGPKQVEQAKECITEIVRTGIRKVGHNLQTSIPVNAGDGISNMEDPSAPELTETVGPSPLQHQPSTVPETDAKIGSQQQIASPESVFSTSTGHRSDRLETPSPGPQDRSMGNSRLALTIRKIQFARYRTGLTDCDIKDPSLLEEQDWQEASSIIEPAYDQDFTHDVDDFYVFARSINEQSSCRGLDRTAKRQRLTTTSSSDGSTSPPTTNSSPELKDPINDNQHGFSVTSPSQTKRHKVLTQNPAVRSRKTARTIWTPTLLQNTAIMFAGTHGPARSGEAPLPTPKERSKPHVNARLALLPVSHVDLTSGHAEIVGSEEADVEKELVLARKPWRNYLLGNAFSQAA